MPTQLPAFLIVKDAYDLKIYSDAYAGREAWVLDWDNDMQPSRLSAVIDQTGLTHPIGTAHRIPIEPVSDQSQYLTRVLDVHFKTAAAAASLSHTGRNTVLAALRSLQLHIEKAAIPQGIQETFFDEYEPPSVEELDRLCEALNCA